MFSMQHMRRETLRIGNLQVDPLGAAEGSTELSRPETIPPAT